MRIFTKGINRGIFKVVKEDLFVPTHGFNCDIGNKDNEYFWTKEVKENVQHSLKAKMIIIAALGLDEFLDQRSERK